MTTQPTVPCKWCGKPTTMLGTQQCDGCWELSTRIASQPELAVRMLGKPTTIYQTVYDAMDDWKSGGELNIDNMRVSIDEACQRAIDDWQVANLDAHTNEELAGPPKYLQEFPDWDDDLPLASMFDTEQGWEDTSWHNDSCPSFHLRSRMVSVYVDYLDPAKRASEGWSSSRFTIVRTNPFGEYWSEPDAHSYRDCDTWAEAAEAIAGLSAYSDEQLERIGDLYKGIEESQVKMAVVDYVGRVDHELTEIKHEDLDRRFGVRDLRHVEIYKLHVVTLNMKARQAL